MQPKPINVWLYVLLSLVPFLNIYPLQKLHKIRTMFLIDLGLIVSAYVISFLMIESGYKIQNGALLPIVSAIPLFVVVQVICVYNWAKTHNLKNNQYLKRGI